MKIVINGRDVLIEETALTYEEIVVLAGMSGDPSVAYSVRLDDDGGRSGTMYAGKPPLRLDEGMVITVVHTGNA